MIDTTSDLEKRRKNVTEQTKTLEQLCYDEAIEKMRPTMELRWIDMSKGFYLQLRLQQKFVEVLFDKSVEHWVTIPTVKE